MNTAYPRFQDALTAVVRASVSGVPVSLGYPTGGLRPSHVWIAGTGTVQLSDEVSGYRQRDETMTTEIRIKVDDLGNSYTKARDVVFGLAAQIEAAIAANVTLGGVVSFARVTEMMLDEAIPDERTRSIGLILTVTADAVV